ncbi:LysE/ArgO family amino acid transporter [Aquabacterium humicola]|uniref:LysE/ArgO family amino acid transporter n=1 Tax=Aquabacterium humicola TaxID=3237377 RepID=UPI00254298BB|nr:LysE/ArgO family amino acid transporter [Rubrivivax pictus]
MNAAASLPLLQGWLMMAGLIVAIGAQNAYVLRQGLLRSHVGPVVMLCALSDWLLTALGVFGLGALVAGSPTATLALRWIGAAFLAWYAWRAAQRAWRSDAALIDSGARVPLAGTLATAAAVTWLNPHVYLDTVVLLGAAAAGFELASKQAFAIGAGLASLMWFAALGYGAAALAPKLARPGVWRVIDAVIALVMAATAVQLLRT